MNFITRLFNFKNKKDFQGHFNGPWSSLGGQLISRENKSYRHSAHEVTVSSCVLYLSQDIAKLPLEILKVEDNGDSRPAKEIPLFELMKNGPNPQQTAYDWKLFTMFSLLFYGNSYNFIFLDGKGQVNEMFPIHPNRVTLHKSTNGEIFYAVSGGDQYENSILEKSRMVIGDRNVFMIPAEFILHLKDIPNSNGLEGVSRINIHRPTIDLSLSQREFAQNQMKSNALPSTIIKHPKVISEEAANRLRKSFENLYKGAHNSFKVAVLGEGMEIEPLSMSPQDIQFIENRKMSIDDIARIFRVPLSKLLSREGSTFNNNEQENRSYLTDALLPLIVLIEDSFNKYLLPKGIIARFDIDKILRADTEIRHQSYSSGIQNGYMSPNDVRAKESMNKIAQGDIYLQPLNFAPLGSNFSQNRVEADLKIEQLTKEIEIEKLKIEKIKLEKQQTDIIDKSGG